MMLSRQSIAMFPRLNKMDALVERCSKFSGWKLAWKVERSANGVKVLSIAEPGQDKSRLDLCITGDGNLYELYGRMAGWGITLQDRLVLREALLA